MTRRNSCLFVCRSCGNRFHAPDIALGTSGLSQPQLCPQCGGKRTRPTSLLPALLADLPYRKVWQEK
ncbi:MAG: hypothetical protein J6Y79_04665 [Paludibacteraceae bacterium]|nr:hypothetical protein [Paludibacteraceae bacterium]